MFEKCADFWWEEQRNFPKCHGFDRPMYQTEREILEISCLAIHET